MQHWEDRVLYVAQEVPGKGTGLVALRTIRKGTRILCEEPAITLPRLEDQGESELLTSISRQVNALTEHQRQIFLSLHNLHPYTNDAERYLGLACTVSLPIDDANGRADGGVFLDASRINHACDNNAQKYWNTNIQRHTVHALRDIEEGEEITVYYLRAYRKREIRQATLRSDFGFDCSCRLCSLPPRESQQSDRRLEEIHRLDGLIGNDGLTGVLLDPLWILRYVDRQVRLYEEQGQDHVGLPRAFFDATQIAIAHGDLARARIFAERAISSWRISLGDDAKEVIENSVIAEDPTKHRHYGLSFKWRTAIDDVPTDLDDDDFEDWLWRRNNTEPTIDPVVANLRTRTTFPSFVALPDEKDIDFIYYERKDSGAFGPRRHWCFLAEIIDVEMLLQSRLKLELRDIDGRKVDMLFYTPGRGVELDHSVVQKGNTVALLYAERHTFKYAPQPGLRHEDPGRIKLFPVSLDGLLALSDEVQQYSTVHNGIRTCHGCGKKGAMQNHCARCSAFWYCDKACQEVGWKDKGHKDSCRLLRDQDLRGLFALKWDEFEDYVSFPLSSWKDFP
ncbi:SET domain-containing protein [Coniochaeta sp. PMI_546]|nr:SET domain-containing protein [Coniochaeta sp. PMI_546]